MTDPLTLFSGIASLGKTVAEIAASNDATQRNALLIEFQKALIQSQSLISTEQAKNATLASRNQELEQEIVKFKNWAAESNKYELKEVSSGIFARVEKANVTPLKSAHKFCATCFERQKKTVLQFQAVEVGRKRSLVCHVCKYAVEFRNYTDET